MFSFKPVTNAPSGDTKLEISEDMRMTISALPRITSWINGRPVIERGQFEIAVIDPATEQPMAVLLESDVAEVDAAVKAARNAFDHGPWPRMAPSERAAILRRVADLVDARADELAALESQHTGMPIKIGRAHV